MTVQALATFHCVRGHRYNRKTADLSVVALP